MEKIHEIIEIVLLLAAIVGVAMAYFRSRGRRFGITDLLIFGPLAIGADIFVYKLYSAVAGPHADSAAYEALAALLVLFGVAPVAAWLSLVAAMALFACLFQYPAVRYGVVLVLVAAGLGQWLGGRLVSPNEPGGRLNNSKLAGEEWALEYGAASKADCDRQSTARAFREGCYSRLPR
ncbi:MAG: hypothetical protein D3M94_04585 [Rhodocyclales bacterium GT-UBC]|nr:MAG: hypothetical protein D3M94_04585 [Rhodocyclales bacterium GT-UBC]